MGQAAAEAAKIQAEMELNRVAQTAMRREAELEADATRREAEAITRLQEEAAQRKAEREVAAKNEAEAEQAMRELELEAQRRVGQATMLRLQTQKAAEAMKKDMEADASRKQA